MNVNDAMNLLNLSGEVNQTEIKTAYKKASLKYHPDRNAAGAEMMKAINEAFATLSKLGETVKLTGNAYDFAEALNEKLNAFFAANFEGVEIEVCGNWIWLTGETKPYSKQLGKDGLGFFYASKKKAWYYRPEDYKSRNRTSNTLDEIREKHGSSKIKKPTRRALAA
ncbi:J domain-containing protein [Vibrio vulnificus]